MKRCTLLASAALFVTMALHAHAQKGAVNAALPETARWAAHAKTITVVRDNWGIAHVHGRTDADAVFGMIYAQCEDDFNRVETNYLVSLGRLAEAEGEAKLWQDLRQQLFIDPLQLQKDFDASPAWLKALMEAWADGANFYLSKHPETHPRVITHFEPWMALSFTEGSIGGDIERVNLVELEKFYGAKLPAVSRTDYHNAQVAQLAQIDRDVEPGGSNGAAIAPSNTANHHALLLINPHTSFFFRSELQMQSDEGLNAYGAVTWGQIFIYQGFNDRAGWMHTSSNVDAIDEFRNTVVQNGSATGYKFGDKVRPFKTRTIALKYKAADGSMKQRSFTAYFDHRGPIVRKDGDAWVSIELMNTPVTALQQSFLRTKARTYAEYRATMALMANSSNNTIFASADGDIAYWHGNFIPERDTRYDFTKPVDGSNPATDWQGLMSLEHVPQLRNPHSGWLGNVNNAPWWGAGESSLRRADYPPYVEQGGESPRGIHMTRLLDDRKDFTLDTLLAAAFDPYLPYFAETVPALLRAYDALPADDPQHAALAQPIGVLRKWDIRGAPIQQPRRWPSRGAKRPACPSPARRRAARAVGGLRGRARLAGRHAEGPGDRHREAVRRLRHMADTVGRHQPLPAARRQHYAALRRRAAQHGRAVYAVHLGLAGSIRIAQLPQHQEALWHQRQQLRGGGGVRRPRPRTRSHLRRRKRPPRLKALQRRSRTLPLRQLPRGNVLPRPAPRPRGAHLPSGGVAIPSAQRPRLRCQRLS